MKGYWLHQRFMDIYIKILKNQYSDGHRIKLKAIFMNRGYTGKPWVITEPMTITIMRKDLKNWQPCSELGVPFSPIQAVAAQIMETHSGTLKRLAKYESEE